MKSIPSTFSQQTVKQIEDKFKNSLMRSILAKLLSNKKTCHLSLNNMFLQFYTSKWRE